jgi:hypothetical protein
VGVPKRGIRCAKFHATHRNYRDEDGTEKLAGDVNMYRIAIKLEKRREVLRAISSMCGVWVEEMGAGMTYLQIRARMSPLPVAKTPPVGLGATEMTTKN